MTNPRGMHPDDPAEGSREQGEEAEAAVAEREEHGRDDSAGRERGSGQE